MQELVRAIFSLLLLAVVFTVLLRPIAPGFSNTLNQQLGNCVGRLASLGIGVLLVVFLIQSGLRSCAMHWPFGSTPQTTAPAPSTPIWPEIPPPPEIEPDAGLLTLYPPVRECHNRPLVYSTTASTIDKDSQYSVVYLGKYDYQPSHGDQIGDGSHPGWDIRVPAGTPVYAATDSTVVYCGGAGGWGKLVALSSKVQNQTIYFTYAHLSRIEPYLLQHPELPVQGGALIGWSGVTGNARGAHLHFQGDRIWQGTPWFPGEQQCNSTQYQGTARVRTFDALQLVLLQEGL